MGAMFTLTCPHCRHAYSKDSLLFVNRAWTTAVEKTLAELPDEPLPDHLCGTRSETSCPQCGETFAYSLRYPYSG